MRPSKRAGLLGGGWPHGRLQARALRPTPTMRPHRHGAGTAARHAFAARLVRLGLGLGSGLGLGFANPNPNPNPNLPAAAVAEVREAAQVGDAAHARVVGRGRRDRAVEARGVRAQQRLHAAHGGAFGSLTTYLVLILYEYLPACLP